MKRVVALVLSVLTGAGLALSMQTAASAGDVPPIVVMYSVGKSLDAEVTLIAQVPGSDASVPVSAKGGFNLLASSSTDGRVVAYLSVPHFGTSSQSYVMIRKDGKLLQHMPTGAGAIFPSVSGDGSIVLASGPNGLKAFDVERQRWSAFCSGCPTTNMSSAVISPDHRKVAISRKDLAIEYLEIYRISDGHRLARTANHLAAGNPAWNADSNTVAYVDTDDTTGVQLGVIRTITASGVVADTKFDATTVRPVDAREISYVSPIWINNAVWAIRAQLTPGKHLSVRLVTAKDWDSTPRAFGGPLYSGDELWRATFLAFVGWSAALPTPAH